MFVDKSKVKTRVFDGKVYLTDQKEYKSKSDAKSVVLFLKTKNVSVRARIIEKRDVFVIYFNQETFYEIAYGNIKIPGVSEVPDDIKRMVMDNPENEKSQNKPSSNIIQKSNQDKHWRDMQQERFKSKHKGNFEVIKLDKDIPTVELFAQKDASPSNTSNDEVEQGINATLNHVENEFFKSCQKCGGDMKPTFMLVGQTTRLSIFQCASCKFYIPRRM
jgi:hypothetical protein